MANKNMHKNELWQSATEWTGKVPGQLVGIVGILISLSAFIWGMVALITKTRHVEPPLPWWDIALIIGGAVLFVILSFFAFHNVRVERDEARTENSPQEINKLREERRKLREIYADRANVSKLLLQLQEYTVNEVKKQEVPEEEAIPIVKEFFLSNISILLPGLFYYLLPLPLKLKIRMFNFLQAQLLLNWTSVLKRHNLGVEVVTQQQEYKDLYNQITAYKTGLPPKTAALIGECVLVSKLFSSTILFTTSKRFEEMLQGQGRIRNILPYLMDGVDINAVMLRSKVSEGIEKFLLGESI